MEYCKFLEHWRKFTSGNETPEIIHLWVGLSTLAGAIEKRMWIDQGYFKVFMNLYVVLVGPPGVVAKSTSMGLEDQILRECGYTTFSSAITKEAIIEEMAHSQKVYEIDERRRYIHSSVTMIADELNVLLSTGVDTVKFLVEIFGAQSSYSYKTRTQGKFEIINPYFNLIGAVVPQWFGANLASDLGSTGFLARCILVYEDMKRGRFPRTILGPEELKHKERAIEILLLLASKFGELRLSPEADAFYCDWYMEQEFNPADDYRILAYLERRTKVHILKVAGLMALGDLRDTIEKIDVERAIHLLKLTERKMRLAYLFAGNSKYALYLQKVIAQLQETALIPLDFLARQFYTELTAREFREVVEYVEMSGAAKRVRHDGKVYLQRLDLGGLGVG